MKNRLFGFVKKAVAPVVLVASMAAFSPVTAMAAERGFHGGRAPAQADRGRGFQGNGDRGRGFQGNVDRGRGFREYGDRGRDFRGRPGYFVGPRYRPGFSFGVGVYPYTAPVCNPSGFYDQFGVWHFYPGCEVPY